MTHQLSGVKTQVVVAPRSDYNHLLPLISQTVGQVSAAFVEGMQFVLNAYLYLHDRASTAADDFVSLTRYSACTFLSIKDEL